MRVTILGSGSSGNCTLVESGETRLLVDAGFSGKQIRERLALFGRKPEELSGIILTHEHGDHCAGLPVLCERLNIPLYCNRPTADYLRAKLTKFKNWQIFVTGQSFVVGAVNVENFPIPHDAAEPVGYVVSDGSSRFGFVTDLGHATKLVVERVRGCQAIVLEANHDVKMLQDDTRRPWEIKQRILSRHGHLSNNGAAEAIQQLLDDALQHVFLGHLSSDCNRPELALQTVRSALVAAGAGHIQTVVARQDSPMPTLDF
jgi:phosphoribosyl 1,2-cyclic phosphodiesterase